MYANKWQEQLSRDADDEISLMMRMDENDQLEVACDTEETPEKRKAVVIYPQSYYDNLAKKRKKRNKTASKSRKINRGKK